MSVRTTPRLPDRNRLPDHRYQSAHDPGVNVPVPVMGNVNSFGSEGTSAMTISEVGVDLRFVDTTTGMVMGLRPPPMANRGE